MCADGPGQKTQLREVELGEFQWINHEVVESSSPGLPYSATLGGQRVFFPTPTGLRRYRLKVSCIY